MGYILVVVQKFVDVWISLAVGLMIGQPDIRFRKMFADDLGPDSI